MAHRKLCKYPINHGFPCNLSIVPLRLTFTGCWPADRTQFHFHLILEAEDENYFGERHERRCDFAYTAAAAAAAAAATLSETVRGVKSCSTLTLPTARSIHVVEQFCLSYMLVRLTLLVEGKSHPHFVCRAQVISCIDSAFPAIVFFMHVDSVGAEQWNCNNHGFWGIWTFPYCHGESEVV